MTNQFKKIIGKWIESGYDGLVHIPLQTTIYLKGSKRHIINHNGVSFIWVNGNKKCYPFVFLPIKNYSIHSEIETRDFDSYKNLLEYISLLSFTYPNIKIDIYDSLFKNYFGPIDSLEQEPWIDRIGVNDYIHPKEHGLKDNMSLSPQENLILSFFREGNNSNNLYYSFLSHFKILELILCDRKKRKNDWNRMKSWIDQNKSEILKTILTTLTGGTGDGKEFIKLFEKSGKTTIGDYLIKNHRDAVAHSKLDREKIKSANSFNDYYEIYYASQFIKAAAYLLIRKT